MYGIKPLDIFQSVHITVESWDLFAWNFEGLNRLKDTLTEVTDMCKLKDASIIHF